MQAVPGYTARRALFEHYVRTRAEEERKEKRAAQKAAIEGFKQLLEEASEVIFALHYKFYHVLLMTISMLKCSFGANKFCYLIWHLCILTSPRH